MLFPELSNQVELQFHEGLGTSQVTAVAMGIRYHSVVPSNLFFDRYARALGRRNQGRRHLVVPLTSRVHAFAQKLALRRQPTVDRWWWRVELPACDRLAALQVQR